MGDPLTARGRAEDAVRFHIDQLRAEVSELRREAPFADGEKLEGLAFDFVDRSVALSDLRRAANRLGDALVEEEAAADEVIPGRHLEPELNLDREWVRDAD